MDWKELLGLVGGALTTTAYIPQVWRLFKLKSAREISLPFNTFLLAGIACWLAYGLAFGLLPVVLWNALSLVLISAMLFAKCKYGR